MKLTVTTVFVDKITGVQYEIGDVIDISNSERAEDIVKRGLAKEVKTSRKASEKAKK